MPTLTVRNIPQDLYDRIRKRAAERRRSISAEVVTLIEEALAPRQLDADLLIAEAQAVYCLFPEPLPDLINEAKREGRK